MSSLIFQTRLVESSVSDYERVHATIPADLERDIRAAGCAAWEIRRSGTVLTHVTRVEDADGFFDALDASDAHAAWQQTVSPFIVSEPLRILEDTPADPGALVWRLPEAQS